MKHITCYIIENWDMLRLRIKRELPKELEGDFVIEVTYDKDRIENCLRHIRLQKLLQKCHIKKFIPPDLIIVDLYKAEGKNDHDPNRVFNRIVEDRIPKLEQLRQRVGSNTILIVISQYITFFKEFGNNGRKMTDVIEERLGQSRAEIAYVFDKYTERDKLDELYSNIKQLLTRREEQK